MSTIIVIDRITELPIEPQVAAIDGDWVSETLTNGSVIKYEYHPPVLTVDPIRIITVRAFMQRFTQAERIAMRASVDDIIVDMMEDLRMASYVDLDDATLAAGLGYVNYITLIAAPRPAEMLVDGTLAEKYSGIL